MNMKQISSLLTAVVLLLLCGGCGQESAYFKATKIKAKQGDADAQYKLGEMYDYGRGVPEDFAEAGKWYRKAAEQGHAEAQYKIGKYFFTSTLDWSQADVERVKWFRKAAEQGHARAQGELGWRYEVGWDVPQDYEEAAKWYRKAAEQGDEWAQLNLGEMYYEGEGVQDYEEAVKWFRKAAVQGYYYRAEAQFKLGLMYHQGEGVPKNYMEAVKWWRKAAEQGYTKAQRKLCVMYYFGRGVTKDEVEAYAWGLLAIAKGDEISSHAISSFDGKRLTAKQMEKGKARALELHHLIKKRKPLAVR